MKRFSFKQLYVYGISLITLLMVLFGIIQLAQHIVNLAVPDIQNTGNIIYDKRGIYNSLIQIVVAFPVYLYHWRLARKSEE